MIKCKMCLMMRKITPATKYYKDPVHGKIYVCSSCSSGIIYRVEDIPQDVLNEANKNESK